MDYEKKYKEALELARVAAFNGHQSLMEGIFPELKEESENERISKEIIKYLEQTVPHHHRDEVLKSKEWTACLEKQGDSPIKWNKNTKGNKPQVNHSVLMKTTHGIAEGEWQGERWHQYRWAGIVRDSDVLSWMELSDLDKQGEQKSSWSIKEKLMLNDIIETTERSNIFKENYQRELIGWLKSLKNRYTWKPSIAQLNALSIVSKGNAPDDIEAIMSLYNDLKKLRGE